jgi:hypothetical protein
MANHVPRVRIELAEAERDLLVILLDTEDNRVQLLTDLEQLGRFADPLGPRHFGNVDEAFHARLEFNKGAVGHEIDHFTVNI